MKDKWISVSERLPDERTGKVLIVFKEPFFGGFIDEIETGYYEDGIWLLWRGSQEITTEVTHWALLPEPPTI